MHIFRSTLKMATVLMLDKQQSFDWCKKYSDECTSASLCWDWLRCLTARNVSYPTSPPLHLPTSNWFIYFDCALRFKHNAVWTTVSFHSMSMETNFINLFRTQINRTALLSINPPGPATIYTNWHWHHLNDISMNEMNLANAVTITVPLLSHSICSTAFEMMAIDGRIGFLCKNWFYLQSA